MFKKIFSKKTEENTEKKTDKKSNQQQLIEDKFDAAKSTYNDCLTYWHNVYLLFLNVVETLEAKREGSILKSLIFFIEQELSQKDEIIFPSHNLTKKYTEYLMLADVKPDAKKIVKEFKELLNIFYQAIKTAGEKIDTVFVITLFYIRPDLTADELAIVGDKYKDFFSEHLEPMLVAKAKLNLAGINRGIAQAKVTEIEKTLGNWIKHADPEINALVNQDIESILSAIHFKIGLIGKGVVDEYEKFHSTYNHKEELLLILHKTIKDKKERQSLETNITNIGLLLGENKAKEAYALIFKHLTQTQQVFYYFEEQDDRKHKFNELTLNYNKHQIRDLLLNNLHLLKQYLISEILTKEEMSELKSKRDEHRKSFTNLKTLITELEQKRSEKKKDKKKSAEQTFSKKYKALDEDNNRRLNLKFSNLPASASTTAVTPPEKPITQANYKLAEQHNEIEEDKTKDPDFERTYTYDEFEKDLYNKLGYVNTTTDIFAEKEQQKNGTTVNKDPAQSSDNKTKKKESKHVSFIEKNHDNETKQLDSNEEPELKVKNK